MHTYGGSSRRFFDEDSRPSTKKRRVQPEKDANESETNMESAIRESSAAVLSSPSRRNSTVFSEDPVEEEEEEDDDDVDDLSTPPSSPPPPQLTPPPANSRKPTFSFLKKKRSSNGTPLTEVNSNTVRSSAERSKKRKHQHQQQQNNNNHNNHNNNNNNNNNNGGAQQPALKQMQIDLGGDVRKTCSGCGMEYVPSNSEDVALHKKFHDMNSTGIDLGKSFVRANAFRWVYETARFDEGYVVIIDRKSSPTSRNQAMRVLEVVNKELSAVDIEDSVLWSQTEPPKRLRKNGAKEEADRFKVFLHMKDSKCVGLCLTERIWESHIVTRSDKAKNDEFPYSSSITIGEETQPATVGISRVWTSASSRRKGIALDLLDCVAGNYFYGMEIPKSHIAFSQPTESGCRLLEAFYGDDEQWHVYKE